MWGDTKGAMMPTGLVIKVHRLETFDFVKWCQLVNLQPVIREMEGGTFQADFEGMVEIMEGGLLASVWQGGATEMAALDNLVRHIRGKQLAVGAMRANRREIEVPRRLELKTASIHTEEV
jgi:hypothetical protein